MKRPGFPLTEDILGDFGFRVRWEAEDHYAKAVVWEISAREDGTNIPLFDPVEGQGPIQELDKAQVYLEATVKWDGCTHVNTPGYWHWCGPGCYRKHIALVEYLYRRAFELMGEGPEEAWEDSENPAIDRMVVE